MTPSPSPAAQPFDFYQVTVDFLPIMISVVLGVAALLYTTRSLRIAEASKRISETAAQSSAVSASASQTSAAAAEESARHAASLVQVEASREHDRLRPLDGINELQATYCDGDNGRRWTETTIRVDRPYRVRAVAVLPSGGTTPLPLFGIVEPGNPHTLMIEDMPPDRTQPKITEIIIDFWPPVPGDPGEHWTCFCGRPVYESDNAGHWQRRISIKSPPPAPMVVWR